MSAGEFEEGFFEGGDVGVGEGGAEGLGGGGAGGDGGEVGVPTVGGMLEAEEGPDGEPEDDEE